MGSTGGSGGKAVSTGVVGDMGEGGRQHFQQDWGDRCNLQERLEGQAQSVGTVGKAGVIYRRMGEEVGSAVVMGGGQARLNGVRQYPQEKSGASRICQVRDEGCRQYLWDELGD